MNTVHTQVINTQTINSCKMRADSGRQLSSLVPEGSVRIFLLRHHVVVLLATGWHAAGVAVVVVPIRTVHTKYFMRRIPVAKDPVEAPVAFIKERGRAVIPIELDA